MRHASPCTPGLILQGPSACFVSLSESVAQPPLQGITVELFSKGREEQLRRTLMAVAKLPSIENVPVYTPTGYFKAFSFANVISEKHYF